MPRVEFRLLGGLEVEADGVDLTPAPPKQRALLAFLLLRAGEVVGKDELVEALWGERPPETAQTALHGHISALRKRLGAERIETRSPGYLLRLAAGDELDVGRFEQLVAEAPSEGRSARSEKLREALTLFRGEPLYDFRYEAFASGDAARLDELRLTVLEEQIQAELELGRHTEIVPELERLIAENPLREGLRAQLMVALYRAGRQADALQAFQQARVTLVDELGIDPSPALRQLERRILNQDPELAAPDTFLPTRHDSTSGKPVGIVTFLSADVEISARPLVRTVTGQHGGFDVGATGDAVLVAFGRARDAVAAAVGVERATTNLGGVRIGINSAEAISAGKGYTGPGPRGAASLRAAAHRGQILLSQTARDLLREAPVDETLVRDLGVHHLNDLTPGQRLFQLVAPDLGGEFAPLRTLETQRTNLSPQPTPLVGREREIREVADLLRSPDVRHVTLTGTGGTGKTRLAVQTAAELLGDFDSGAFFIALAPLRDPDLVLTAVARTLGIQDTSGESDAKALGRHLRDSRLLLVLDNFEHLLEAAAAVGELSAKAPAIKLLVTSRAVLGLPGERPYPVEPLERPSAADGVEQVLRCESVLLFASRARAARPDFAVTADNARAVAGICNTLDGLPLAIELAATRIAVLSPAALRERLDRRLQLLNQRAPDVPARHRSLRAAIDWSYELLGSDERKLFVRLAVFVGGCTLAAAEGVCGEDLDVVDGLSSLVDSSLVVVEGTDEEPRFAMLETIREYAAELLDESAEGDELRRRHIAHFVSVAEEAEPHLRESPGTWLDRLEREHDNVRAALDRVGSAAEDDRSLRLAGALWRFWYLKGHLTEGRRRLEDVLANDERPTPARAKALLGAAVMAVNVGDTAAAVRRAEEAVALSSRLGDAWGAAYAGFMLGNAFIDNDQTRAQELFEESAQTFRRLGDHHSMLLVTRNLARIAEHDDRVRARALHEDNLRVARVTANPRIEASTLGALATIALDEGRLDDALAMLEQSVRLHLGLGDLIDTAADLSRTAAALSRARKPTPAVRIVASFEGFGQDLGARGTGLAEMNHETLAATRAQLDAETFAEAWEQGRLMTSDEALALALSELSNDALAPR
jgi:predicted ATPase/DNA-binding SARP family transcriptional activator